MKIQVCLHERFLSVRKWISNGSGEMLASEVAAYAVTLSSIGAPKIVRRPHPSLVIFSLDLFIESADVRRHFQVRRVI
jgi:hypothetical protein